MSYQRTLAQLRTSFLIRGSYENSADITPAVALEILNDALLETYDVVLACSDDYYIKVSSNISIVANTDTYVMPSDFYELRKVEIAMDSALSRWMKLLPVPIDGANRVTQWGLTAKRYRYRLSNLGITLAPVPTAADTFRVWYVPLPPQLASDSDTVTFDRPIEQKLVLHIALRDAYQRQDLDTQVIDGKIMQLRQQLRTAADSHDDGEPFYLSHRGPEEDDGEWGY